jgi:hypothetical protein
MTWQPGQPILTIQDHRDWIEWKRINKAEAQRYRRTKYRRIDYCEVSPEAAEVIDQECWKARIERRYLESAYSIVLNRIVTEWQEYQMEKR